MQFAYQEMKTKLKGDPRLMDKMIPKNFNVGCRRPTPGNGYLEALIDEKTTCFTETIGNITETGFTTTDGAHHEVDVIICATGFDTSYRPRFPIIGVDGANLADQWAKFPSSYVGLAASNIPNYFMFSYVTIPNPISHSQADVKLIPGAHLHPSRKALSSPS